MELEVTRPYFDDNSRIKPFQRYTEDDPETADALINQMVAIEVVEPPPDVRPPDNESTIDGSGTENAPPPQDKIVLVEEHNDSLVPVKGDDGLGAQGKEGVTDVKNNAKSNG